ncbi:MAG: hypothetical protein G8345_05885 [Magnetococcales bacterium]|nr:hypothetical protein [Magnetococcales bacterium]NGZ26399.1 hypothetical protein [Magnetococcales bacterium]
MFAIDHPAYALLINYTANDNSGIVDRWNWVLDSSDLGTAASVTYSFLTERKPEHVESGDYVNFQVFTAEQEDATRLIFSVLSEYANITFTEVDATANGGDGGEIRFGRGDLAGGVAGYGYYPGLDLGGDIVMDATYDGNFELAVGELGYGSIMHEIGHAIGLEHPSYYGEGDEAIYTLDYFNVIDNSLATVMTYNDVEDTAVPYYTITGNEYNYGYNIGGISPMTAQLYDIAAMQILYGANTNTRAGNSRYSLPTSGVYYQTIWDGGGLDLLDCSDQVKGSIIDLNPGTYSSIGYDADPLDDWPDYIADSFRGSFSDIVPNFYTGESNVAIAFDCVIENVLGSEAGDNITGNDTANLLFGQGGVDTLEGGAGNDFLNGGSGDDVLTGGVGNDTFVVDSINDQIIELSTEGVDRVRSVLNWTLSSYVENLTLLGADDLTGAGNGSDNRLLGNQGNNSLTGGDGNDTLDGGAGADTLAGGLGDDFYELDNAGDVVNEGSGEGSDTVRSRITYTLGANQENLILFGNRASRLVAGMENTLSFQNLSGTGNGLNNGITGNNGDNTLDGGDGNDTLTGGLGADSLTGGAGADTFRYMNLNDAGDTINDFSLASDKLEFYGPYFGQLAAGEVGGQYFVANTSGVAQTAEQRFVYNTTSGLLSFDADGVGGSGAVAMVTLNPAVNLAASNILIINS